MDKKFYTVKEIIDIFGEGNISKAAIYNQIKEGKIPAVYIGTRTFIPAQWVNNFLEAAKKLVED